MSYNCYIFLGEMRIHDPRVRRGGSRGNMARNGDDDRSGGPPSGTQVRDPRRRPQLRTSVVTKQVYLLFKLRKIYSASFSNWLLFRMNLKTVLAI